jgi:DNA-binding PucR family transcriptional regulator
MNTLKVYLECSGSVQLVAENLGVHRNTINYKMKIIRDILGVELNDEEKMKIFLAFRVREVLGQHRTKNN